MNYHHLEIIEAILRRHPGTLQVLISELDVYGELHVFFYTYRWRECFSNGRYVSVDSRVNSLSDSLSHSGATYYKYKTGGL